MTKEKTRNGKRWTEARFRSFVTSALRGAFRRWAPKYECLQQAGTGRKLNKKSGRLAQHFACHECGNSFTAKEIQVDHIKPIGTTVTWDQFIEALFCEAENLQVLCKPCHKKKTKKERTD